MPSINFKEQFADKVLSSTKNQTIRGLRKVPIRRGDVLYLFTGLRTSKCKRLKEVICKDTVPIEITSSEYIILSGTLLSVEQHEELAINDGFYNYKDMLNWFKYIHGLPFVGNLITW